MKRVCCIVLLLALSNIVFAQTGKITGKVISASSGLPLSGATLKIIENEKTKVADQNGVFSFSKLDTGNYSIKCSYVGFEDKIIEDIVVKNNENTDVNISLDTKISGVVVVTSIKKVKVAGATIESLLSAQRNSANIGDGVSAQTIKQTPDTKSSDVIRRVSGASIQDDKFAIIRGLNDRYNAAFINGAPLPSTESDRKAFSFDIFPSAIIDNLIIYKTATPDKSGEFAGGIIELTTKSTVSKGFTTISIGQSYNTLITGKNRFFSEVKGKTDWLGIDDGSRGVPVGLASTEEISRYGFDEKLKKAKLFENMKWGVKQANTRPNFNFQLAKAFNIDHKEKEFFAAIFSINYNRSFSFSTGERNSYVPPISDTALPVQRRKYTDSIYNEEIIWAALGNISLKINNRNNISWKNNFSVNTDNKLIKRIGAFDFEADPLNFLKETGRWYTQDKIYTTQLIGEHQIGSKKTKVNWLAGYSKVERAIPNISRTQYTGQYPDVNITTPSLLSGVAAFGGNGSMFSTNSNESIKNIKVDITQPYTFMKNTQNLLKLGAGYQFRSRVFTSRNLGLTRYDGFNYTNDLSIYNLPEDQLFLAQNLGVMGNGKAGLSFSDATLPNSSYDASSAITHAYIMSDQRFFKKIRLIYGLRFESFNQKLNTPKSGTSVDLDTTNMDFLPSVNFVYAVTPKINLRLSYTETVNRPEFRELAPFLFYDFVSGFNTSGDTTTTRAKIKNYDFRFEYYPGKSQLLSFSIFHKKFNSPIELIQSDIFAGEISYKNTASASAYGVEAEFRVLLSTLFGIKREKAFLNRFVLTGNGALIKSNVVAIIGGRNLQGESNRPLQGQSPYLLNGSLGYSDEVHGFSSTISLNRIGDRLVIAGTGITANLYEKARTVLDFQIAKSVLKNKVEFKFNARDILAQRILSYYDFSKSASYKSETNDRIFSSTFAPRVFSFTATLKL